MIAAIAVRALQGVDYTQLAVVLAWLASGVGAAYIAGKVASYAAANWVWFQGLSSEVKTFLPVLASVLVAVGAQFALQYAAPQIEILSPWFGIIINTISAYFGTQKAFIEGRAVEYGKSAYQRAMARKTTK